jgi:hypothetical protein
MDLGVIRCNDAEVLMDLEDLAAAESTTSMLSIRGEGPNPFLSAI